jgi:hypothetical protein
MSRDGTEWVAIEDNIDPRRWGTTITVNKELPKEFLGIDTLWIRVRCLTESAPVENGYNVAQFARTRHSRKDTVFEVMARLRDTRTD